MRKHWLSPWSGLLLAACTGSCAGPTNGTDDSPPPPPPVTRAYVAVTGDDASDGSQSTPFKTIARALTTDRSMIVVGAGRYAEELTIARSVLISGSNTEATIVGGHVFIASNDVTLERIGIDGGLAVNLAEGIVVATATIAAGDKDDAVSIASSSVALRSLTLRCGAETCAQLTTATVAIDGLALRPLDVTKRGIRAESASVAASRVDAIGTSISQVHASGRSSVLLRDSTLSDAAGNGMFVVDGGLLVADGVTVRNARRFSLLEQGAIVRIRNSTLGASTMQTVGASAGTLSLFDTIVEGSPEGSINIIAHSGDAPRVRLVRGEVRHGALLGISHSAGTLTVDGTRFIGDENAPANIVDHDAIESSGMDTRLDVRSATFVSPVGAAIYMRAQAAGTITATITAARTSGIIVEESRINETVITGGRIDDCAQESGIVVLDADMVRIEDVLVSGCPEAGVLAGEESIVQVQGLRAIDNPGFGVGAFGGSTIHLAGSTIRGSGWATFATCADGAQVIDEGGNDLSGATTECP